MTIVIHAGASAEGSVGVRASCRSCVSAAARVAVVGTVFGSGRVGSVRSGRVGSSAVAERLRGGGDLSATSGRPAGYRGGRSFRLTSAGKPRRGFAFGLLSGYSRELGSFWNRSFRLTSARKTRFHFVFPNQAPRIAGSVTDLSVGKPPAWFTNISKPIYSLPRLSRTSFQIN